ncbi:MAG: YbaY family lipoprotein, partial [Deinococcus sp.]|uniref:YbaY family lipoprotein n=1 Tax=Deinococcus sp. TaxID=47478 RepID=UPI0026DDC602
MRQERDDRVMKSKVLISLVALLTVSAASAQTQVGQVTLTPVNPPVQSRPGGVKPRPVNATPTNTSQATATKTNTFQTQQVPAGWYNLTGQVGGISTSLPKGTQVVLSLEEVGNPSNHLLQVKFGASRLPVPYQMYFNSARLQTSKSYGVRAKVYSPEGKLLYTS